jgi:ribosomal protein S18 acetylase RimI-like enzyme
MTSALPLEILDLRHYSATHLRPILDHEDRLWDERLHWDFKPSAELLLQYLDSHILPGYIAVENGQVVGYIFCVYEESKAVIGDVYAHPGPASESTAVAIENRLSEFVIELLQNSPGVDRIEAQLILHPYGAHRATFDRNGFTTWPRLFMSLNLKGDQNQDPADDAHTRVPHVSNLRHGFSEEKTNPPTERNPGAPSFAALGEGWVREASALPPSTTERVPHVSNLRNGTQRQDASELRIRPWQDSDFNPAGRLIADAYSGHLDSIINDQYRTIAGSLRFLHNIVRFPGCGIFDPAASFVITGPSSDQLAGLLLCSRIRPDVAHVTQICVAAPYRGQGLASRLLDACIQNLVVRKVTELTLTVTEGNTGAVALYRRSGFRQTHTFPAMTWQRQPRPPY